MNLVVAFIRLSDKKSCLKRSAQSLSILFLLLTSLFANNAQASHAVAAEITYSHVSGLTYAVRVWFYRDCAGVAAPASIALNVTSGCGNAPNLICTPVISPTEVMPVCSLGISTCNSGPVFGIKQHIYSATITLPFPCANWRFSFQVCCRNAAITNISSPGSASQYFFALLNNLNVPANNSAYFIIGPTPFQCVNNGAFSINSGATDADGDSLVFSLVAPSQTISTNVNFIVPYTSIAPLSSSPAMTINASTGMINIWPLLQGIFVMAVKVREYRGGVLVGTIQRDMQVNMTFCPCTVPLPVEIVKFGGANFKEYNLLEWATASETGNDYFEVERSTDGMVFNAIGKVEGAGNTSGQTDYNFRDNELSESMYYYRLRQVDFNGLDSYSEIITLKDTDLKNDIKLSPLPFNDDLNVYFSCKDAGNYTLSVRNIIGVLVRQFSYSKPEGSAQFAIHNMDLSDGYYLFEVANEDEKKSFKILSLNE